MLKAKRRGRPHLVAIIPFNNQRKVQLLDEFYAIVSTFRYPEVMAVSRGLDVHPRTVDRWKYRESFPRWDIALDVIEWHKQGKPVRRQVPVSGVPRSKVM